MPTPPLSDDLAVEALDLVAQHGSITAAALAMGIPRATLQARVSVARARGMHVDPAIRDSMAAVGTGLIPALAWAKTKNPDGTSYSVLLKPASDAENIADKLRSAFDDLQAITPGVYSSVAVVRPSPRDCLLVVDLADVHIGKLSVKSETGYSYDRETAVRRMVEGTAALLAKAKGHGATRVLFVIGNDILHIDTSKRMTTSGTPQDTDGSIHQMYLDAQAAYLACIELCAADHVVDFIYCPSNHDWLMGWALANSLGMWFSKHPNVNVNGYNISEAHRKYYRYERNLIGLTHADGAKEKDLYPLMMTEARSHISECHHRYWLLHHNHHKVVKAIGVRSHDREKDHIGMTTIKSGIGAQEGDNMLIEHVRSPSPPDGWHDRNGYVNRQAVECFVYDPHDGQTARFTVWF